MYELETSRHILTLFYKVGGGGGGGDEWGFSKERGNDLQKSLILINFYLAFFNRLYISKV